MLMYGTSMMLGRILHEVFLAGLVVKFETLLGHLVKQPKVSHFHCARSLSFNRVIRDAYGCRIINMDRSMSLWVDSFL